MAMRVDIEASEVLSEIPFFQGGILVSVSVKPDLAQLRWGARL